MKKISLFFFLFFLWTCSKDSPTKSEPIPLPPSANNISLNTDEDTSISFTMTGSNQENGALTFSISTPPINGQAIVSGSSGTYTPNENFHGSDSFTYTASNGKLVSKAATVSITIVPVDDDPNSKNISVMTEEDTSVVISLEADEYDGDSISFSITSNPSNGTVTLSGNQATYSPNENYFGNDSFTFEATDSSSRSILNSATAFITVTPVNDPPVVEGDIGKGMQFSDLEFSISSEDIDGDQLTFFITSSPNNGTTEILNDVLTYKPNPAWHGLDSLKIIAYDGSSYSKEVLFNIEYDYFFESSPINYKKTGYENKHSELWLDYFQIYLTSGLPIDEEPTVGYPVDYNLDVGTVIADFNGDGFEDILFSKQGGDNMTLKSPVELFINDQSNTNFVYDNSLIIPNASNMTPREANISDFNGDGKPDVAYADHDIHESRNGTIAVLLSSEEGYKMKKMTQMPTGFYHNLSIGDINNDGNMDIVAMRRFGNEGVYALINDGQGNFTLESTKYFDQSQSNSGSEVLYDLNKDGYLDFIVTSGNPRPPFGDEEGNCAYIIVFWGNSQYYYNVNQMNVLDWGPCGGGGQDSAFADLNNDGKEEVIYRYAIPDSNFNDAIHVLEHDGNYNYTNQTSKFVDDPYNDYCCLVFFRAQDIDNDGMMDIFNSDKGNYNYFYNQGPVQHWEWNGSIMERK